MCVCIGTVVYIYFLEHNITWIYESIKDICVLLMPKYVQDIQPKIEHHLQIWSPFDWLPILFSLLSPAVRCSCHESCGGSACKNNPLSSPRFPLWLEKVRAMVVINAAVAVPCHSRGMTPLKNEVISRLIPEYKS